MAYLSCCTATRCDLRDPGWGDPGFPQRGLLLPAPDGHLCFLWCYLFAFQMARVVHSTQDAVLISQELALQCGVFVWFVSCGVCLVLFLFFCVVFVVVFFVLFSFSVCLAAL